MAETFPIAFTGTVKKGKGIGRTLGFPTANLAIEDAPHLRYGVYAARIRVRGVWYGAIANVGRHPTLPEGLPTIEVHVPGHALDMYGETIEVRLTRFMRPEQRFESPEALRAQVSRDIASL